jgi:ribosome maturation factor RimP
MRLPVRNDETIRKAWSELEPQLAEQGYELVEVEFGQEGSRPVFRLYIDRPGGITLDDCQAASRFLSPVLDAMDLVDDSYFLEVSSPGFDRPVRKPVDFERFTGERIKAKTILPVEGRRQFKGVLKGYKDGQVSIEIDGRVFEIHTENLLKANLER